jgi:thiol-disulfide isomerase/thioredoxin
MVARMRLACLVIAVAACAGPVRPRPVLAPATDSARLAPLEYPLLDGGTFASADAAGRVLVLDVWASYCAPCAKAFPVLARLGAARPDVVVVGLSIDEEDAPVRRFLAATPAAFPIARDRTEGSTAPPLAIRKVPTLFLIDRAGRVRLRIEEPADADYAALPAFVDALRGEAMSDGQARVGP